VCLMVSELDFYVHHLFLPFPSSSPRIRTLSGMAHHQIQYRTDMNLVDHTIRVIREIFPRDQLFLSAETWHLKP